MEVIENEFSWSKSRDSLFRSCLRAYYYHHYGAWGGWQEDAPAETRELYVMKGLASRAIWRGVVIHDVAERAIRAMLQNQRWPLEEALAAAEARMEKEVAASAAGGYRHGIWLEWGGRRIRFGGLVEHYYGLPLPETAWREDLAIVDACVRNLYRSATFRRLQEVAPDGIVSVEELESVDVEGTKVWVKLDVCVRGRSGEYVIIDWKTGMSHRPQEIALQLGIYGLFGSRRWGVPAERIAGFDVNLRQAVAHNHTIDADVLEKTAAYIVDSAARMRALLKDPARNVASIEQFPMTTQTWKCKTCRFRKACGIDLDRTA